MEGKMYESFYFLLIMLIAIECCLAFNEECKGCEFKKICAGGCAYSALLARKDLMKRDPLSCEYSKKLYELFGKRR